MKHRIIKPGGLLAGLFHHSVLHHFAIPVLAALGCGNPALCLRGPAGSEFERQGASVLIPADRATEDRVDIVPDAVCAALREYYWRGGPTCFKLGAKHKKRQHDR